MVHTCHRTLRSAVQYLWTEQSITAHLLHLRFLPHLPVKRNPTLSPMDSHSILRGELAIRYPAYGHALGEPDPDRLYDAVDVGDVGFIRDGYFHYIFNALLPPDTPESTNGPMYPPRLQPRNEHHIRKGRDSHQEFLSENVTRRSQDIYAIG
jgi:hypothetical protein